MFHKKHHGYYLVLAVIAIALLVLMIVMQAEILSVLQDMQTFIFRTDWVFSNPIAPPGGIVESNPIAPPRTFLIK